ncbi:MAG: tyrosine-type recombinase/integrase [Rhodospirillales bacterium]
MFAWAIDAGKANTNPAIEVHYIPSRNPDGWHTATVDEVRQFENRHPIGTKARLALSLFMFTGVRKSDAVRLGRQLERPGDADSPHGWLCFTETKGRNRHPKPREIPILPELRAVLDATPSGHLTYLVTQFGKPFTANGFGNWFRKRCDEAGLPLVSAHTLRKAAATIAAENGANEYQLMVIFEWMTPKEAARYVRKANRKKLIISAMRLVVPKQKGNPSVPLS